LRIVAGRHRGRKLAAPPGEDTRPTSDRAREALFNILERGPPRLRGCRFLDLFAGTGVVALEALSRGAAAAVLVENARPAAAAIRANIAACGEGARARLLTDDAAKLGRCSGEPFDIVFLDPPYLSGLVPPTLGRLARGGWLVPGARVVCELAADEILELPAVALDAEDQRRYGAARLVFLRFAGPGASAEPIARHAAR
jgi:16S rRNA (guanine966-N2)-methyltransferase